MMSRLTQSRFRWSVRCKLTRATLLALTLGGVIGGCGRDSVPDPEAPQAELTQPELTPSAEPSFAQQVARGRSGNGDRIELLQTRADDALLTTLDASDAWVETLILDQGVISDRGVPSMVQLPGLLHLRLRDSPLTDEGLSQLARCESLRILNLPQCEATAVGIAKLAGITGLRNLRIGGPRLEREGSGAETAAAIASIQSLVNVHLIGVPIDDEGLRRIVSLPKLKSLYLDDSQVTPSGWEWLFETHPRLHVHVNQQHLDRGAHDHAALRDDQEQE